MIIIDVDGTFPVFGLIKDIFFINSSVIAFEYQRYETLNLNQDLLAYEVAVPTLAQATELVHELIDYTSYFFISFKCVCAKKKKKVFVILPREITLRIRDAPIGLIYADISPVDKH